MIQSFGDRVTEDLYHGQTSAKVRRLPKDVVSQALYKLDVINAAVLLSDLRSPPGNKLEALKGELSGFYSIRINRQWRIIFRWQDSNAFDVQIVDYH